MTAVGSHEILLRRRYVEQRYPEARTFFRKCPLRLENTIIRPRPEHDLTLTNFSTIYRVEQSLWRMEIVLRHHTKYEDLQAYYRRCEWWESEVSMHLAWVN